MTKIIWFLVSILLIGSLGQIEAGDRWELIMGDNLTKHFFDGERVKLINDDGSNRVYLDVWIKVTYSGTGKDTYRESLKKAQISTAGYEKFSYAINHVLFEEGKICLLGVYDYTDDGLILRCFDAPVKRWIDIIPGSTMEVWYEHVIAFAIANMNTIVEKNA